MSEVCAKVWGNLWRENSSPAAKFGVLFLNDNEAAKQNAVNFECKDHLFHEKESAKLRSDCGRLWQSDRAKVPEALFQERFQHSRRSQ